MKLDRFFGKEGRSEKKMIKIFENPFSFMMNKNLREFEKFFK